jgi:hypothetical protein
MLVVGACLATLGVPAPSADAGAASVPASYGTGHLVAADPSGGYWTATAAGAVAPHGGAPQLGYPSSLNKPIVGMASTANGGGYWLVATDGGIFSYGNAHFLGSTGSVHLNQSIVGMASTADGNGYWLVATDGGIFSYGDAPFFGSTGSLHLNKQIVGMAPTADGRGYWLVASDGGIFSYGDAGFFGSTGSLHLNQPIVGMAPTPDGRGYWLVAADGGIFTFGDAPYYGSLGGQGSTALGLVINSATEAYSVITSDGNAHAFSPPPSSSSGAPASSGSPTATTTTTRVAPTTTTTTTAPGTAPQSSNLTTGAYAAAIQGGTTQHDCAPTSTPTATSDPTLDSIFTNQAGPGWVGGDIGYSTALPNGQESFVFGDTLIGSAQPSGAISLKAFVHGSEMVGTMPNLQTSVTGTASSPQALIPDSSPDGWQTAATYMENGQQLIFVNGFQEVQGSLFQNFVGASGIAAMSLSSGKPVFSSVTPLPTDPITQWGVAMTQSGGYDYVYGEAFNTASDVWSGMKVARVPVGLSLATSLWTYWTGSGWVAGEANAVAEPFPFITGIIPLQNGTGFMGVGVGGTYGQAMHVSVTFACSPTGPWSSAQTIYTTPETTEYPDEFAYMATLHPEISDSGGLVLSYSINSLDGLSALQKNDHLYQPRFIQISG